MFEPGDAVVHPKLGAGIVTGYKEFEALGGVNRYYEIELFRKTDTSLMVPVKKAKERGIRPASSEARLQRVLEILSDDPKILPKNHKRRHKVLREKLQSGDVFEVAEAIRDLAWRRRRRDGLTTRGRRIYRKAMHMLSGEIAAVEDIEVAQAEARVQAVIQKSLRTEEAA